MGISHKQDGHESYFLKPHGLAEETGESDRAHNKQLRTKQEIKADAAAATQ